MPGLGMLITPLFIAVQLVAAGLATSGPREKVVDASGTAKLNCPRGREARKSMLLAEFRWYRNDRLFMTKRARSDMADFTTRDPRISLQRDRLVIRNARPSDAGTYGCHVIWPLPERWHNYSLQITGADYDDGYRDDYGDGYWDYYDADYASYDYYPDDEPVERDGNSTEKIAELCTAFEPGATPGTNGSLGPRAPHFDETARLRRLEVVLAGSPVTFRCPVRGCPPPRLHWLYQGQPVLKVPHVARVATFGGTWLRLSMVGLFQEGSYTCVAENTLGSVRHVVELVTTADGLYKDPLIEPGYPRNVTALAGSNATFECPGSWDFDMDLFWMFTRSDIVEVHNISDLSSFNRFAISAYEQRYDISGQQRLVVRGVSGNDSGFYTCLMYNHIGFDVASAHLRVVEEVPRAALPVRPANASALLGSRVTLECPAAATATSGEVIWLRSETGAVQLTTPRQLEQARRCALPRSEVDGSRFNTSSPPRLIITNVAANDSGYYVCVVHTAWDVSYASAYVAVVEGPGGLPALARWALWLVSAAIAAIAACTLLSVALWYGRRRDKRRIRTLTKRVVIEASPEEFAAPLVRVEPCRVSEGSAAPPAYLLPLDPAWEVARHRLELADGLGEGCFGRVVRARLRPAGQQTHPVRIVAVKMLKEHHCDADLMDLVSEMEVMKKIGPHVNVVSLIGACTRGSSLMVIMEYAEHGNLLTYLRERRETTEYERPFDVELPSLYDLVNFAFQVARGMEYLASRKCIHRDLAARNVLVGENKTLKIADFGMARDVKSKDYYRKVTGGRLPVKWMAPEALFDRLYTTESDVWSFGVLMWEIMTMGDAPYPTLNSVDELGDWLRQGRRMARPPACPVGLYDVMLDCWRLEPARRPSFGRLVQRLDGVLVTLMLMEYVAMASPQTHVEYANVPRPAGPSASPSAPALP
ncbi:fibroblast growth factor receptor 1-like isoform X2 [Pollicipes pollicipes]|uniref:fibroblast growth factor receptor 1-like isoform X2 n=1 Tax=Pollicipes pollicipes TaxID=41117 RepID=UPI001884B40A|nr:fibroblast growth factor receptor 1-like isoform X2 [Pollicipes pollicipes]